MSALRYAAMVLGVLIVLYGVYAILFEGTNSAFVFITGGAVISALGAGLFDKAKPEECEE
ncbi:MAG: hypothetical protein HRT64_13750 [Erythrobacter sp.]|nr:hypothetical protein [Erythrobacter sp.]